MKICIFMNKTKEMESEYRFVSSFDRYLFCMILFALEFIWNMRRSLFVKKTIYIIWLENYRSWIFAWYCLIFIII